VQSTFNFVAVLDDTADKKGHRVESIKYLI